MATGVPAIADHAFLSDRHTACLVARTGAVDWWCVPRIDSGSCFAALLDAERGGHMLVAPTAAYETRWEYLPGTLVLRTTMRTRAGEVELTDLLALTRAGAADGGGHMVRLVEGRRGSVRMRAEIAPRFDYGEVRPWIRREATDRHVAIGGNDALAIWSDAPLEPTGDHTLGADLHPHRRPARRVLAALRGPARARCRQRADRSRAPRRARRADRAVVAALGRRGAPAGRRAAGGCAHAVGARARRARLERDRRDRRSGDDLAARGRGRQPQLGLPLLLDPRLDPGGARARRGRLRRPRPTGSGASSSAARRDTSTTSRSPTGSRASAG